MKIYPVILSGGSGTRLWPLSRAVLPKQLLPLVTDRTMLQETVLRVHGWADVMPPLIVCGNEHRFLVAEQLRQIGVEPTAILLEPEGRNTAPAVASAALFLSGIDPDAVMLVLPADHVIGDIAAFEQAVRLAAQATGSGSLVTFGIVPDHPETGYGYIRRESASSRIEGIYPVAEFVEKPDLEKAQRFVSSGEYAWNSGIFLFRTEVYLNELMQFRPDIAGACQKAVQDAYKDMTFCRLHEVSYLACPSESIDYAVMEKTSKAAVVLADIGWNDVGSWTALSAVQQADDEGNVLRGDVYTDSVKNSLVRADTRLVAVIGLDNIVVVETKDAVLISAKDQVQRVKNVVEHLKHKKRSEHQNHSRVYRPWGCYESIDGGDRFQVKRITVNPGEKLSLQMHHHRAEHWVVVTGTARVTNGDVEQLLTENESIYIPIGSTHRLENPGKVPLHLIEVQSGAYLGEDDIVRFDDVYKRA
ncbi:MAG: mannose-1-phosphate guanylyltransferase/mannose-6-phosphate isomerase [Oxalicibacterium faecigallinarum]|uniref:mannose-1-phosphate guanylyltransferase/mannose-6-phosphate isomerase n=1 Tax=Oxalicibacterium faecigallinarum TaxID=573741 RepID=UPI002809B81A|nr:mannose-1-phosphate guanylyltransferase/mannose-6-phosphate isomerase [Oxalicibacterium faecigallinarum]MDQ7969241.1 mannose-1-phosphate guanylyltransferase/mannose-6-phosphate isomerase [Oxalicibacterium faecigallinarum]